MRIARELILLGKCGVYFAIIAGGFILIQKRILEMKTVECPWCRQQILDLSNNPEFVNHHPEDDTTLRSNDDPNKNTDVERAVRDPPPAPVGDGHVRYDREKDAGGN